MQVIVPKAPGPTPIHSAYNVSKRSDLMQLSATTAEYSSYVQGTTKSRPTLKEESPKLYSVPTDFLPTSTCSTGMRGDLGVQKSKTTTQQQCQQKPAEVMDDDVRKALSCDQQQPSKPDLDWTLLKQGKLYGRDFEIEALQQAFQRRLSARSETTNSCAELVLVSGNSGCGKSVLTKRALRSKVEEHHGYFIVGKFDQLQTPEPYRPFVDALTQLVYVLEQANRDNMDGLRKEILGKVGREACHVLCALVPALSRVLGIVQEQSSSSALSVQQERLKMAVKKFFQVVCSKEKPIVLTMDDLQWSDVGSLNLLESLVIDDIDGLVVVGTCRSNEVPWHHTFADVLRRLEDEAGARIAHIQVKALPIEATNSLLSDMLRQPVDVCNPLSIIIHEKSCGNIFFILQILRTLYSEGVLVAGTVDNGGSYQWLWHDDKWESTFQKLDIVELVSYQIRALPDSCQKLLKAAACLGADFDEGALSKLLDDVCVQQALKVALEEQMVVQHLHRPDKYAFAHDRIQQSALNLIPKEELPMTHLTIGRSLLEGFNEEEMEANLFLVVNQLIRGIPLLTTEIDKNGLAELCLQAGIKATRSSDFETARQYFASGTGLLSNRHWRDEYYLSLQLFNCRAEVESGCGDFAKMDETIREVHVNCRTPRDKLEAHLIKMKSLQARAMFQEATDVGFELMASLNQRFPSKPRFIYIISELLKVKKRLKGKTDQDILNIPRLDLDNKNTVIAMNVLQSLSLCLFCSNPNYYVICVLRMLKLTLKHGHSALSAFAFSCYGMILCATEEFEEAYRYSKLSVQLLERDAEARMEFLPRVNFLVYAVISPWRMPLKSTFDSMRVTIAAGIEHCDFECFVYSAYTQMVNTYMAGDPLQTVEALFNQYFDLMKHYKLGPWLSLTNLLQRLVRCLRGKTENPLALDLDWDDWNANAETNKFSFQLLENTLMLHRMALSYHLGDVNKAVECAKAGRRAEKQMKSTIMIMLFYFYDAMAMFEAAHHGQKRQHASQGRKYLRKMENLCKKNPENFLHKVYLLRGETHSLNGNLKKALEFYELASAHAATEGALQFQALAHERAGIACQRLGIATEANQQLQQAAKLYEKWGGAAVVAHVKAKHNL